MDKLIPYVSLDDFGMYMRGACKQHFVWSENHPLKSRLVCSHGVGLPPFRGPSCLQCEIGRWVEYSILLGEEGSGWV